MYMNSIELKQLAKSYKNVAESLERASQELAKIEKIMGTTAKPKAKPKTKAKAKPKTKAKAKPKAVKVAKEDPILLEIRRSNDLVEKALK